MKRIATAFVTISLAAPLVLAGCSSPSQPSNGATTEAADTSATTDATTDTSTTESTTDTQTTQVEAAKEPDPNKEYDDLASWGIKVVVPSGCEGVLDGSEYYLYTQNVGEIPYVMVVAYNQNLTGEEFLKEFTDYMSGEYSDLKVEAEPTAVTIGDKQCWKTTYSYSIEKYVARDTRIAVAQNNKVYMFASKEVDELERTVGDTLEEVVADSIIY